MDIRSTLLTIILVLIISSGYTLAEEIAGNNTPGTTDRVTNITTNQTPQNLGSLEALLNLALDAQKYALDNGKLSAMSAFSDQTSFIRDGMYISAYDYRGVLLADPMKTSQIGTSFIADDHDAGIVRQLRDLAQSGGGVMTPDISGNGISYYALEVDGSWWITAVSGRSP